MIRSAKSKRSGGLQQDRLRKFQAIEKIRFLHYPTSNCRFRFKDLRVLACLRTFHPGFWTWSSTGTKKGGV